MGAQRRMLRELHRRFVWQIGLLYVGASWAVMVALGAAVDATGLPGWTTTMALILLSMGFPVVCATAYIQQGPPWVDAEEEYDGPVDLLTPEDVEYRPAAYDRGGEEVFTWPNAIMGGICAALLLLVSVGLYLILTG